MPVSGVTSADVLEILAPIWHTKAETARRLRQRIRAVLEWAVALEFRIDNPCDRIGPVLGPQHDGAGTPAFLLPFPRYFSAAESDVLKRQVRQIVQSQLNLDDYLP